MYNVWTQKCYKPCFEFNFDNHNKINLAENLLIEDDRSQMVVIASGFYYIFKQYLQMLWNLK